MFRLLQQLSHVGNNIRDIWKTGGNHAVEG